MSSLEKFIRKKVCRQTAVYWGAGSPDGFGGFTFPEPAEIKCRWDDVNELIMTQNGEQIVSRSKVLVTQDLDQNGYLFLGTLEDVPLVAINDPKQVKRHILSGCFRKFLT